ncbi:MULTISPECIES: hypothetical protein [Frankia]|uniref:hypothetical protein n=1 Tax=Frankia TaxID=1854 RepID=UPI000FF89CFB|nr:MULTISPECIES: hypothetical protein [Frankia]
MEVFVPRSDQLVVLSIVMVLSSCAVNSGIRDPRCITCKISASARHACRSGRTGDSERRDMPAARIIRSMCGPAILMVVADVRHGNISDAGGRAGVPGTSARSGAW